jgi:hypothetical protein
MQTYIWKDDQQRGPFDDDQVQKLISGDGARPDDWAWQEGMADWAPLSTLVTDELLDKAYQLLACDYGLGPEWLAEQLVVEESTAKSLLLDVQRQIAHSIDVMVAEDKSYWEEWDRQYDRKMRGQEWPEDAEILKSKERRSKPSLSLLTRRLRIGYGRVVALLEILDNENVIARGKGSEPADVLIALEDEEEVRKVKARLCPDVPVGDVWSPPSDMQDLSAEVSEKEEPVQKCVGEPVEQGGLPSTEEKRIPWWKRFSRVCMEILGVALGLAILVVACGVYVIVILMVMGGGIAILENLSGTRRK